MTYKKSKLLWNRVLVTDPSKETIKFLIRIDSYYAKRDLSKRIEIRDTVSSYYESVWRKTTEYLPLYISILFSNPSDGRITHFIDKILHPVLLKVNQNIEPERKVDLLKWVIRGLTVIPDECTISDIDGSIGNKEVNYAYHKFTKKLAVVIQTLPSSIQSNILKFRVSLKFGPFFRRVLDEDKN